MLHELYVAEQTMHSRMEEEAQRAAQRSLVYALRQGTRRRLTLVQRRVLRQLGQLMVASGEWLEQHGRQQSPGMAPVRHTG